MQVEANIEYKNTIRPDIEVGLEHVHLKFEEGTQINRPDYD